MDSAGTSNVILLVVRGSNELVERVQAAASGRATVRVCSMRMVPRAVAEFQPRVVVANEEMHHAPAEWFSSRGVVLVTLANDASAEVIAEEVGSGLEKVGG